MNRDESRNFKEVGNVKIAEKMQRDDYIMMKIYLCAHMHLRQEIFFNGLGKSRHGFQSQFSLISHFLSSVWIAFPHFFTSAVSIDAKLSIYNTLDRFVFCVGVKNVQLHPFYE